MSVYLNTAWVRQDLIALADSCADPSRAARLRRIARQEAGDPPPPVMPAMPRGPRAQNCRGWREDNLALTRNSLRASQVTS